MSDIQNRINEALEEHERLIMVESHLEELKLKYKASLQQLKSLEDKLDDELKDIEQLESLGVKSLFYKVLGSKEDQLEKERQDFLEASLKYKDLKKSTELQEYEISLLEDKIHQLPFYKKEIDRLKTLREREILAGSNSEDAQRLRNINEKTDLCIILKKNITEAFEEGEKSEKMLNLVLSYLKKARDWGKWDMGGSRRGDINKNRAIDMAMANVTKAQYQLDLFAKELEDLGKNDARFRINQVQFNRFTDFFFDNLISDWIIQQKIKSTIANLESTMDQVRRIKMSLERENNACNIKLDELEKLRNKILLG